MIFKCLFTIFKCKQFSCLFTFLIFKQNIDFCKVFCHEKLLIFSILFTFVSCLFTLCQLFVYYFEFSSKTLKNHDFFAKMATLNSCFIYFFVYMFSCLFTIFSCLFTFFFTWQCKQKCKQTAENHEFKLDILAKKSWNFNVFASNSKSKQTADCLHF